MIGIDVLVVAPHEITGDCLNSFCMRIGQDRFELIRMALDSHSIDRNDG